MGRDMYVCVLLLSIMLGLENSWSDDLRCICVKSQEMALATRALSLANAVRLTQLPREEHATSGPVQKGDS